MDKLRVENKTLIRMILDLIVEQEMVCSEEEFMAAMEKRYGGKPKPIGHKRIGILEAAVKREHTNFQG